VLTHFFVAGIAGLGQHSAPGAAERALAAGDAGTRPCARRARHLCAGCFDRDCHPCSCQEINAEGDSGAPGRQIVREAAARGVEAGRFVFSPPVPHPQHLARAALADLVLDTLNYNAHTTATDALWSGVSTDCAHAYLSSPHWPATAAGVKHLMPGAGPTRIYVLSICWCHQPLENRRSQVPLLTVAASDKMQSRVAAGLTTAAGFPEAVVHSLRQCRLRDISMAIGTLD
jgi:hypothetical protein